MKMLQLSILFSLIFGNVLLANLPDKEKEDPFISASVCAFVSGEIGIKSKGCRGFSLSCTTVEVDVSLSESQPSQPGKIKICFVLKAKNLLSITYSPEPGESSNEFVVESSTNVDPRLATSLRQSSIKTVPGVYRAIKNMDGTYTADIAVQSK
jgi:hypothetical protein